MTGADGGRDFSRHYAYVESAYPLLAVVLIMSVYLLFGRVFDSCDLWGAGCNSIDIRPLLDAVVPPGTRPGAEGSKAALNAALPGRSLWVLVVGLNVITCLAAVAVAFNVIRSSLDRQGRPAGRALLLLCAFLTVSAFAGWRAAPADEVPQSPTAPDARPLLFQALEATAQHDVKKIIPVVRWTIAASYAAAALFALAGCVLLWPARGGAHTQLELARRMRLLRKLLYFGMALLVIVALRFATELHWAEELLKTWHAGEAVKDDPNFKTLESLFSVTTSAVAVTNTLILAAVYLPAAFVLSGRAHRLAEEKFGAGKGTLPEREKWLQNRGLALSTTEYLPRIAALLAPLLAGPIGEIIGKLAK